VNRGLKVESCFITRWWYAHWNDALVLVSTPAGLVMYYVPINIQGQGHPRIYMLL